MPGATILASCREVYRRACVRGGSVSIRAAPRQVVARAYWLRNGLLHLHLGIGGVIGNEIHEVPLHIRPTIRALILLGVTEPGLPGSGIVHGVHQVAAQGPMAFDNWITASAS